VQFEPGRLAHQAGLRCARGNGGFHLLEEGWPSSSPRKVPWALWRPHRAADKEGGEVGLWLLLLQRQQCDKLEGGSPEPDGDRLALPSPAVGRAITGPPHRLQRSLMGSSPSKGDPGLIPRVFHHFAVSWDRHSVFRGCPQRGVSVLPCLAGLTPPLHHVQRLAVVTLMLAAFSATSFIVLLCQLRDHKFGECQDCTPAPQTKPLSLHRGRGRQQKASAKLLPPVVLIHFGSGRKCAQLVHFFLMTLYLA